MGSSNALSRHECGIFDTGEFLVEDIRSGRKGLLIIRHERERRLFVEGRSLPVIADVNITVTGGVKEHRACLG